MFSYQGNDIYMPRGDYGVPLTFKVEECCQCCADELIETDQLRLVISRGGNGIFTQEWTLGDLDDGCFSIELTEEDSSHFRPGVYFWRLFLIRNGETINFITGGQWIVGTQMKRS